jgi:hypothetical protein
MNPVFTALQESAAAAGMDEGIHAVRIIEDYLLSQGSLIDQDVRHDILTSRSLISRAVDAALAITQSGYSGSDITIKAIQAVSADESWLADYRSLVRDDPYKTGNPRKQTINQNLGYFIKKAVGGRSVLADNGKAANVKVVGSIIQSYTPLILP